jgi:hypothetical protein
VPAVDVNEVEELQDHDVDVHVEVWEYDELCYTREEWGGVALDVRVMEPQLLLQGECSDCVEESRVVCCCWYR